MERSKQNGLTLFSLKRDEQGDFPLSKLGVSAGSTSLADGFMGLKLDLNKELIKNLASTFYARVKGVSMVDRGIDDGDLVVIDKSIIPYNDCLAVCYVDGEFALKGFQDMGSYALFFPENKDYPPIKVTADNDFMVWGVVRYLIKKMG